MPMRIVGFTAKMHLPQVDTQGPFIPFMGTPLYLTRLKLIVTILTTALTENSS